MRKKSCKQVGSKANTRVLLLFMSVLLGSRTTSVVCETHWVITEDGKIQAITNSLLNMAQPHDLVQFLRQEDVVLQAEESRILLQAQRSNIDNYDSKDDPQIEAKLLASDPNCIIAKGVSLAQQDLYRGNGYSLEKLGLRINDLIGRPKASPDSPDFPFCTDFYDLDFNFNGFEHLDAMLDRGKLTISADATLAESHFAEWHGYEPASFGHAIAASLKMAPKFWELYNLAAVYWRIAGNAYQAVECARRAIFFSTSDYTHVPMLHLANVFHQAMRSGDSVVVLETAASYADNVVEIHHLLAQAHAATLNFNKSLESFSRALELDRSDSPTFAAITQQRASVLCHITLESALENQHNNLQQTLTELQSLQSRIKEYSDIQSQISAHAVDDETREQIDLAYDFFTYGPIEGLNCEWSGPKGLRYMSCTTGDADRHRYLKQMLKETIPTSRHGSDDREAVLDGLHISLNATSNTDAWKEKDVVQESLESNFSKDLKLKSDQESLKLPTNRHLFMSSHPANPEIDDSWPLPSDCEDVKVPNAAAIGPIFIPPEHKGYESEMLFNEYLNLKASETHPLPWYPPFCVPMENGSVGDGSGEHSGAGGSYSIPLQSADDFHLPCCDHLLGVQRAKARKKQKTNVDSALKLELLNMSKTTSDSVAEVGQRVHSLLKYRIGPRWLLLNLAALYWRSINLPSEALTCLRLTLHEHEQSTSDDVWTRGWSDLALVQLAWLTYTAGERIDDAIVLTRTALEVDEFEPVSRFMMSWFLAQKGNWTGAEHYASAVLHLSPENSKAKEFFRAIKCQQKYSPTLESIKPPQPSLCSEPENSPKYFCVKENGEDHCYLEERMVPGSSGNIEDRVMCPACTVPHCVKPPPLASFLLPILSKAHKHQDNANILKTWLSTGDDKPNPTKIINQKFRIHQKDDLIMELSLIDESYDPSPEGSVDGLESQISANQVKAAQELAKEWLMRFQESQDSLNSKTFVTPPEPIKLAEKHKFPVGLEDDVKPEVLPVPEPGMVRKGTEELAKLGQWVAQAECVYWKNKIQLEKPTSTWLSITAKGLNLNNLVNFSNDVAGLNLIPVCPSTNVGGAFTLDHLAAFKAQDGLVNYKPEKGLKDAFEGLGGVNHREQIDLLASRLALAMRPWLDKRSTVAEPADPEDGFHAHYILTTVAALYWRIKGDAKNAIKCLRHSLHYAPPTFRDLALVSLANIYHQSGYLHSALIAGGAALDISPKFVVVHFSLANIYSSMNDLDHAALFYFSTLALQNTFEPARDRLKTIFCVRGRLIEMPPDDLENI